MGSNSKIEWCDHTFNPWMGCTKVSDGCKHCGLEFPDKEIMTRCGKKVAGRELDGREWNEMPEVSK